GTGACSADPNFQPFSRRLVYQLTSLQTFLDDESLGPGGFAQYIDGVASLGPEAQTPELLAVGGFAPGVATRTFEWSVIHNPAGGYNNTDFFIGAGNSTSSNLPGAFT